MSDAFITLAPPVGQAPYRRIVLSSGTVVQPNFNAGAVVTVVAKADAAELEGEGWVRIQSIAPLQKRGADDLKRARVFAKLQSEANLAELAKRNYDLAIAYADLIDKLEEIRDRGTAQSAPVYDLKGLSNGAMHAGVAGADLSAAFADFINERNIA